MDVASCQLNAQQQAKVEAYALDALRVINTYINTEGALMDVVVDATRQMQFFTNPFNLTPEQLSERLIALLASAVLTASVMTCMVAEQQLEQTGGN